MGHSTGQPGGIIRLDLWVDLTPSKPILLAKPGTAKRRNPIESLTRQPSASHAEPGGLSLFQVLREVLVHLEHGHLLFPKDQLKLAVGQDLATVLRIL